MGEPRGKERKRKQLVTWHGLHAGKKKGAGLGLRRAANQQKKAGLENKTEGNPHWSTWKWALYEVNSQGSMGEREVKGRSYSS